MTQKMDFKKGDSLFLGSYPQGADGESFPIEWTVLDAEENRVLVVSRYVLSRKPFHSENAVTCWEDCSLRLWLNGDFMNEAFSKEELEAISDPEMAESPADKLLWQLFGLETATSGIRDRVFLLSVDDIGRYYPGAQSLFCPGASTDSTAYAADGSGERPCWWLRSSMNSNGMAHIISPVNSIGMSLIDGSNENGVRPAMWLRRSACQALTEPSGPAYALLEPSVFSDYSPDEDYEDLEDDFIRQEERVIRKKAGVPPKKPRPRAKLREVPANEEAAEEPDTKERFTSAVINEGVTEIADGAFEGCEDLETVIIPDSVTKLGRHAFRNCRSLKSIVLPEKLTEIGYDAFKGCENLEMVRMPISVTKFGRHVFRECRSLKHIELPYGVTEIADNDFMDCDGLETLFIPDSVTRIGRGAFRNCRSLKHIELPYGVTEIADNAFHNCKNLETVTLPNSVTRIGSYAFYDCMRLKEIELPNGIMEIAHCAFDSCGLQFATIPASVEKMEGLVFTRACKLQVSPENIHLKIENDMLLSTDGRILIEYRGTCGDVVIPDGVTEIGNYAFWSCYLESVSMPPSVSRIGSSAFYFCYGLEHIVLPNGLTTIETDAFHCCSSLKHIVLPDGLTTIGDDAFAGCPRLDSIMIPDGVTEIRRAAFWGCSNLRDVHIPDSVIRIGYGAFWGCSSLTDVHIPDSVISIESSAFEGCSSLKDVHIPDNGLSIHPKAFGDCSNLSQEVRERLNRLEG